MIDPLRILPHREPFLFLHQVSEHQPGVRAVGSVTFAADHPYALGQPAVPAGLVIEAMAQVGCVAAAESTETPMRGLFRGIQDCVLSEEVPFGEKLELFAEVTRRRGRLLEVRAGARLGRREVASGALSFATL